LGACQLAVSWSGGAERLRNTELDLKPLIRSASAAPMRESSSAFVTTYNGSTVNL
jgi:hypothetical protein